MALRSARLAFFYLLIPAILLLFVFSFLFTRSSTEVRYPQHPPPPPQLFVVPSLPEESRYESVTSTPISTLSTPAELRRTLEEKLSIQIDTGELYSSLDLHPLPNETNPWTKKLDERLRNSPNTKLPLKVIIVPHSHNDPGWLNTYDQYYSHYTNSILDSVVKNLGLYPNMTFVWSEMSFLSRWWDQQHPRTKAKFKKFLHEGRLEITTGGWVMTDEGPAHYYDMLDELIEGHQFLKNSIGVEPKNSWSVDPFGHGATFPYLLQQSGIENMYIQRTHFAWKRHLAETQQLEFFWRQQFQTKKDAESKILCHMSPLELYSYKYACGPDYKVCLDFDFRKIAGENSESTATFLTKQNIHSKSLEILDQYQKLGSMFSHNVALVLLGDDFRYNYDIEWKQQYENYQMLMEYVNSNPQAFNSTEIKFGTLNDYFEDTFDRSPRDEEHFPNLVGDFMPYADVYVNQIPNYWTGYFSTRPHLKSLNRQLQRQLRTTEILYSLARQHVKDSHNIRVRLDQEYRKLSDARQNLGLFQHHDGITGTSKEYVMADYGQRMMRSIQQMSSLAGYALQNLALDSENLKFLKSILNSTSEKKVWDQLEQANVFKVSAGEQGLQVLLFNSHLQQRYEKIKIQIEDPFVKVVDIETGEKIPFQINPIFDNDSLSSSAFELEFGVLLPALSLRVCRVLTEEDSLREKVKIIQFDDDDNSENQVDQTSEVFLFEKQKNIVLENDLYRIGFDSRGLINEIEYKKTGMKHQVSINFFAYESVRVLSGAYLFKPKNNKPEEILSYSSASIHQIEGKQSSSVVVNFTDISFVVTLHHHDPMAILSNVIELNVRTDIGGKSRFNDREVVMKIQTDIRNGRHSNHNRLFATDSNGFQMLTRQYVESIGVEANYYPMTAAMFVENRENRLTLLTSTSLGATSPDDGSLEVMLDRRTTTDDHRGLSQGVLDNVPTELRFFLILEANQNTELTNDLSPIANSLELYLNHPSAVFALEDIASYQADNNEFKLQNRQFLPPGVLCNNFLINLRTLPVENHFTSPSNSSLLLLNKKIFSDSSCQSLDHSSIDKHGLHLLNNLKIGSIVETSLTALRTLKNVNNISELTSVRPSQIGAFNITFV